MGLPALVALVAMLVALWRGRSRPTDRVTWAGLAGLGVEGLGQDMEHFRHVWVMIGLAAAGPAGSRKDGESPSPAGRLLAWRGHHRPR